jgi:hypothetical protein
MKLSESRQIKADYQAKFGNYSLQASKLASQSGMGRVFEAHLQRALDSKKPMNFDEFCAKLLNTSVRAQMVQATG